MVDSVVARTLARLIVILGIASAGIVSGETYEPAGDEDTARVEAFHELLIVVMQTPVRTERENLLADAIPSVFDIERISAISLGRTWRELDEEERKRFTNLLTELIVATYASRFARFDGQRFKVVEVRTASGGNVVRTQLQTTDRNVSLDYFLRNGRVFNVVADGVSDLSLRRADYNQIIKTEGYEALLLHLEEQTQRLRE